MPAGEKKKIADALLAIKMPHKGRIDYKAENKPVLDFKEVLQGESMKDVEVPSMSVLIVEYSSKHCPVMFNFRSRITQEIGHNSLLLACRHHVSASW